MSRFGGPRIIFARVKGCTMRHLFRNRDQHLGVACLLFWWVALWRVFIPTSAICENSIADEIISLNATDRPLAEVLEDISIALNCQFSIDESWDDYPITASFANEPLYKGLKRVLRNINNAIIYGADRTIRIIIYDEAEPSGKEIRHSVTIRSPTESLQQVQPFSEATAPQPELGDPEDGSDTGNDDQPPEEAAESGSESGATEVEENPDDSETVQAEPAAEQANNQSGETESTLEPSENSEKRESDEESNQN
jgi:hypothetical protein